MVSLVLFFGFISSPLGWKAARCYQQRAKMRRDAPKRLQRYSLPLLRVIEERPNAIVTCGALQPTKPGRPRGPGGLPAGRGARMNPFSVAHRRHLRAAAVILVAL